MSEIKCTWSGSRAAFSSKGAVAQMANTMAMKWVIALPGSLIRLTPCLMCVFIKINLPVLMSILCYQRGNINNFDM